MRKLFVFLSILAMACSASAVTYFQVDPADVKDHYTPGEAITINIVTTDDIVAITIDAITDNCAGGQASEPITFDPRLNGFVEPGTIVNNEDCILIEYIALACGYPAVPATGILYSFEYYVPDVMSPFIEIGTYADEDLYWLPEISFADGSSYEGHLESLIIPVMFSNCTVPDVEGLPINEAIQILSNNGWNIGLIAAFFSDTIPVGQVVEQDPPPGSSVPCDTFVNLTYVCRCVTCGTCLGDWNGDGWVRINDLTAMATALSGWPNHRMYRDECDFNPCCDINGDDWVRLNDYTDMTVYISGIPSYRCKCGVDCPSFP